MPRRPPHLMYGIPLFLIGPVAGLEAKKAGEALVRIVIREVKGHLFTISVHTRAIMPPRVPVQARLTVTDTGPGLSGISLGWWIHDPRAAAAQGDRNRDAGCPGAGFRHPLPALLRVRLRSRDCGSRADPIVRIFRTKRLHDTVAGMAGQFRNGLPGSPASSRTPAARSRSGPATITGTSGSSGRGPGSAGDRLSRLAVRSGNGCSRLD